MKKFLAICMIPSISVDNDEYIWGQVQMKRYIWSQLHPLWCCTKLFHPHAVSLSDYYFASACLFIDLSPFSIPAVSLQHTNLIKNNITLSNCCHHHYSLCHSRNWVRLQHIYSINHVRYRRILNAQIDTRELTIKSIYSGRSQAIRQRFQISRLKSETERTNWIIHKETHKEIIDGMLTLGNEAIWRRKERTHGLNTLRNGEDN